MDRFHTTVLGNKCMQILKLPDGTVENFQVRNLLLALSVTANSSYVDLLINPADAAYNGAKFIHTAQYFRNQNPLTP
jgi:hypothetical protein